LFWEEYKKDYPEGYSYTQFCFHLKEERQITQAPMRLVHKPGELMMADFAGDHMMPVWDYFACRVILDQSALNLPAALA
jgi:hypothetical protein